MAQHEDVPSASIGAEVVAGTVSRRNFMKITGLTGAGVLAGTVFSGVPSLSALTGTMPILSDANGVLIHDVSRCVACRRCELACSEFNDGAASSYLARVKVGRNLSWGGGAASGMINLTGKDGNFRVQADTCKQCPHPVPCATACPKNAIVADAQTGARKVDETLCIGCGYCTKACPWAVITLKKPSANRSTWKATKCFLCDGNPECARACPTGALKFVSWRDLRLATQPVQAAVMPPTSTVVCADCHN
jgi:Fe-S-cluster-containing dehydrogenase component